MKKGFVFGCVLLTMPLLAKEDDWSLNNSFAVWGDVAFIRRALTHPRRMIIDINPSVPCNCPFRACGAKELIKRLDYEPGFQVGMAYMTRRTVFEAKYLWVDEWSSSCHLSDPGNLYFSDTNLNFTQDFSGADHASAAFSSRFQNAEMNYFLYTGPRRADIFSVAWMAGVRYMDISENLEIAFVNPPDRSTYVIHTLNRIPALQIGGALVWNPWKVLSWDFTAKVGMGCDFYRQHTFLGDQNNTVVIHDYHESRVSTPLLVETDLSLTYQPWKFMNIHAGYQMLYVNGFATASNQIDKRSRPEHVIYSNGLAIFHGWTAGVTFSF